MLPCARLRRVFRTFVLLGLGLGLAGCILFGPKLEKPALQVVNIELKGGSLSQQTFLVTFSIDNPNRRSLPVKNVHAELTVEGQVLAGGVTDRAFVVPARGHTQFDMTIRANVALVLMTLASKQGAHAQSVNYQLTGAATLDSAIIHNVPFRQVGVFPLSK